MFSDLGGRRDDVRSMMVWFTAVTRFLVHLSCLLVFSRFLVFILPILSIHVSSVL